MSSALESSLVQEIKTHLASIQSNELIFSYGLDSTFFSTGMNLILHQQETGFSLIIRVEKKEDALYVNGFTLIGDTSLEIQSSFLYDAAVVEIVLQSLMLLFFVAKTQDIENISFTLVKNEVEHLSTFDHFFDMHSTHFILSTSKKAYGDFVKHTQILKTKVRCELWSRQRDDHYLRHYLQAHQKGNFLSINPVEEKNESVVGGNVIAFPSSSKNALTDKAI